MKKFFLLIFLFTNIVLAQDKAQISGKVLDGEMNNEPLLGATVIIKGTTTGAQTDFDGNYTLSLAPGTYTLTYSYVGYNNINETITLAAGEHKTINKTLKANSLEEIVIVTETSREKETALLSLQKKSVEIKQQIGAQELSRKGISNVEQAVTKATGITKVASRGVFVRGLDERYNYLTVNSLPIAPINWENKIPDLSLFTSSIIKNIDINKIFYSNLYGDFAGATINVNTKDRPKKSFSKVSFSAGVNFQSISNDFLTDKENGDLNYFGFGGKNARKLPSELSNENYNSPTVYEATGTDAINAFNADWNVEQVNTPLTTSIGLENGGVISNNGNSKTAYYIGLNYGNSFDSKIGNNELRNPSGSLIRRVNKNNSFDFKTNSNLLLSLFNKSEKNEINFNYLFLKTTSNSINDNFGRYTEISGNLLGLDSKFQQSFVNQFQLLGNYKFGDDKLHYGLTYGASDFAQPDNNVMTLEEVGTDSYNFSTNSGKFYKYYLNTENNNIAGTLSYDLVLNTNKSENQNKLNFGVDYNRENLDVYNRFILVNLVNIGAAPIDINNVDTSLNNLFLSGDANYSELVDTRFLDIRSEIFAGKLSYNHNFSDKFNVLLGARFENFERSIGKEATPNNSFTFNKFFVLPSFNAKYALTDKMNLRLAGSKTYTKPKNIEIVNITRQNSIGDLITGNPNLENSDNYNVDLKWEFFPDKNSLFSVNFFGKYINKPIERLVEDKESFVQTVFKNTDKAYVLGAEIETRTSLGFILNKDNFDNLTFGTNLTLMTSEAKVSEELQQNLNLTNATRRLQGASDMLLNADVSYKVDFSENINSQFTVLFNTFSKRISAVGSGASTIKYDDEFEKPFNNLSFVWKNEINKKIGITVKVNNILNDTYEREITSTVNNKTISDTQYKSGTSLSLSASYTF